MKEQLVGVPLSEYAPARQSGGFLVVVATIFIPAFSLTRFQLWEHQFIAVT